MQLQNVTAEKLPNIFTSILDKNSNCDGIEFELTSMKIDLRFVDSKQKFPFEPKEICTEVKQDGKINNFLNRSLNHTNVKLTWVNLK